MGEKSKKELVKKGTVIALKCVATALATARRSGKAADIWLDKIYSDSNESIIRKRIEGEFVGKYIFTTPRSNPIQVVWGHVQNILWREHIDGDLIVKHPVHGYLYHLDYADIGVPLVFDSEKDMQRYVEQEYDGGKIREGSFKITLGGSAEYGELILISLYEYADERQEYPILVPSEATEILHDEYQGLVRAFRNSDELLVCLFPGHTARLCSTLASNPMETSVLSIIISHAFSIVRMAALSEKE